MASAVYSGRGLKRTLGADLAVADRAGRLGHGRRSVLAKIDRASNASRRVERSGAAGDAELDAFDGGCVVSAAHVLAGG